MKALVCGINYAPEMTGIGKYTGEMCAWLAARGHEVTAVTSVPHYPAWRVPEGYDNRRYRTEWRDGVRLRRCPMHVPESPRPAARLVSQGSFMASATPQLIAQAMSQRPDVVMAVAPSLMSAAPALLAARLCGAQAWLHIQDFEVDAAFDLGLLHGGRFRRFATGLEGVLMRRFDVVSTISPRMMEMAVRKGVAPQRLVELRNWVDIDAIRPLDRMTGLRAELGLRAEHIVALYSGSMVGKQGLDGLIGMARGSADSCRDLVVLLCGDGPVRTELVGRAAGLPNIRFLDLQPLERLPELLSTADLHLLPQRAEIMDLVMPSKLPPMMASARPVVAQAAPRTQVAIEVEGHGLVVPPGDEDALSAAVARLAGSRDLRETLGAAGRKRAVQHWSRDPILEELEAEFETLARARANAR